MDEAVFLQILNSLLEKAKKKKNELDYGDINDAFKGFEFDEEKMEEVYEFLEAKKLNCWMMLMHWKVSAWKILSECI